MDYSQSGGQQAYQPAGGYQAPPPPPAKKGGFNWLACCGITCLVLLIIGGLVGFCTWRMIAPFMGMGLQMASISETVSNTDIQTIKASAVEVDVDQLKAGAKGYEGQWLKLTGELTQAGQIASGFSTNEFNSEDMTSYVLGSNIVVMDVTKAPSVGGMGDTIVAYGKCYSWDLMELEKMPFFGGMIAEELKNSPEFQGNTSMVFFMAKEVTRVGVADQTNSAADTAPPDAGEGASGWMK
ncbi:hypothetical protein JW859_05955 [bacterium]|nr:hypothetical protein [bacterium]